MLEERATRGKEPAVQSEDHANHVAMKACFDRVLAAWAIDALKLRRSGTDRPGARERIRRLSAEAFRAGRSARAA